MMFRVHFTDGSTIDVNAGSAAAARDIARSRRGDTGIVSKVKVVREDRP